MLPSNRREDWRTPHPTLMLFIGVAAAGISVSPASATVRIISDPGGPVIDYVVRFEAARVSGEPIIIDGACLSACTLAIALLPRRQVCAAAKAVLGFHAAWRQTPNGGRVTSPLATQVMYELYPANVRKWIAAAYPPQGPRACRYGAGLRRGTCHPHPPHDAYDQAVITFPRACGIPMSIIGC